MRTSPIKAIGLLVVGSASIVVSSAAESLYPGAVPCPSNSSIVGYTNLTSLNYDIFAHYSTDSNNINVENEVAEASYHYVLCPQTTFVVGSGEAIVPATDNSAFSCGHSHNPKHNCVLMGGSFQVYFLDFLALQDIYFRGITFVGSDVAGVYGDAHPTSLVYFVDCVFKNHVGISTVYIFFTPYDPSGRRLQDDSIDSVDKRPAIADKYEAITKTKEVSRDLQEDIRYSMGVLFRSCHFLDNKADDSIILNVGGEVALIDTKFDNNEATKLAIFTTLNNGHAYIASGTYFNSNQARLGPIFIDKISFLQYSQDSDGADNAGHDCEAIFIEDDASNCAVPALDAICEGQCCKFGDISCDLNTEPPTKTPTIVASTSPSVAFVPPPPSQDKGVGTKPGRTDNNGGGGNNDIQLAGLIETTKDVPANSSGGCTGYCVGFSMVLAFYVVLVAVLVVLGIRRRKRKKENSGDGSMLGSRVKVNDDDLSDKSFA